MLLYTRKARLSTRETPRPVLSELFQSTARARRGPLSQDGSKPMTRREINAEVARGNIIAPARALPMRWAGRPPGWPLDLPTCFSTMLRAMWHANWPSPRSVGGAAIVFALGASLASPAQSSSTAPKDTPDAFAIPATDFGLPGAPRPPRPATRLRFPPRTTACPEPDPSGATNGFSNCGASAARPGRDKSIRTSTPWSSSVTRSPRVGAGAWAPRFPASRSPTAASVATPPAASC